MDGLKGEWNASSSNHEPVYDKLRTALIAHEFKPGEHLMIAELADRYGVSSTPVREALSRLREERLVAFAQGKGYSCPPPDLKELRDLYQTLGALLAFAATAAVGNPAVNDLKRIATALEANDNIIEPTEVEAAAGVRTEIVEGSLRQIIHLAGNQVLSRVIENAIARTHAVRLIDMETPDNFQSFVRLIGDLSNATDRGDREAVMDIVTTVFDRRANIMPALIREIVVRQYLIDDAAEAV